MCSERLLYFRVERRHRSHRDVGSQRAEYHDVSERHGESIGGGQHQNQTGQWPHAQVGAKEA